MADSTVVKYRVRIRKPPSQTWKSFLRNHANEIVAIDFFIVPTVTFNILYGFVVLLHNRRQVVHFNATAHPTALSTPILAEGSRFNLWGRVSQSSSENGNRRSDHDCAVTVAESKGSAYVLAAHRSKSFSFWRSQMRRSNVPSGVWYVAQR